MQPWGWALLALFAVIVLVARSFYARFRGVCRRVREELTEWAPKRFPGTAVVGEQMGNLVVRLPDGAERIWEMADIYTAVARLPGMGQDPAERARTYEAVAAPLFPALALDGPLSREAHGALIKPRLVPAGEPGGELRQPVAGLPLEVEYVLDVPPGRLLTSGDAAELGLDPLGLHQLALENLGKEFPGEMVAEGVSGSNGAALQLGDGSDAARLLLLPQHLKPGQEVLALIPHRDLLLLLPAELRDDPQKLEEGLKLLECDDHPPLLNRPVLVRQNGFEMI
jgi:hypothetical protein